MLGFRDVNKYFDYVFAIDRDCDDSSHDLDIAAQFIGVNILYFRDRSIENELKATGCFCD